MPDRRGHGKGRAAKATRWWRGATFSLDRFDEPRGRPWTGTTGVVLGVSSPLRGAAERGFGVLLRRGAARACDGQRTRSGLRGPWDGVRAGAEDAVVPPAGRVMVVGMQRRYRCPDDDTGSQRRPLESACRGRRAFARREGASPPPSLAEASTIAWAADSAPTGERPVVDTTACGDRDSAPPALRSARSAVMVESEHNRGRSWRPHTGSPRCRNSTS